MISMSDGSIEINHTFRGWARPGDVPPGAYAPPDVPAGETLDYISGHFRIFQLRDGHRFSTDDVLTAWYGTTWCPSAGRVLDLGSGIGSVALIAAWRLRGARLVTVEAQPDSVALARKSVAYNGLSSRCDVRLGDFRDASILEREEPFELVLGSPPYFPLGTGMEGDHPQKVACRFELRGDIGDYCRTAAAHLARGGIFACVFPLPDGQRDRLHAGARSAHLVVVRERPVVFREGADPLIGLFVLHRRADLPPELHETTWIEPPLVIRQRDGQVHPEYRAVKLSVGFPP